MSGNRPVKRAVRVGERIRAELMDMLLRGEIKDPRAEGVTVTHVRVTDDLQHARVFVRTLGETDERGRESAVRAMQRASGFARRQLGSRLETKYTPELAFEWDGGVDRAARLDRIFDEIRAESSTHVLDEPRPGPTRSMERELARAVELVRAGTRFLVCPHRRPDGDALGSALGLAAALQELGKQAVVYSPDPVAYNLVFLPGLSEVVAELPGGKWDATFVTDTAAPELLPTGFPSPEVSGPVVVLDHHVAGVPFGDVMLHDAGACATGLVVKTLLEALGMSRVSERVATPIYAAIVADTGGFRHRGTDADTLRVAADLLDAGVDPWDVAYHLFEGWPRPRVELLREALGSMETLLDGRLVLMRVPRAVLARAGATPDMVEGLVAYGRRIVGVEVAAMLVEAGDDTEGAATRVSLRSPGTADVASVAVALGGGGHRAAAGATVSAAIDDAAARVIEEVARELDGARRA